MEQGDELALIERRVESLRHERDRASAMRLRGVKLLLLLPVNFFLVLAVFALFGGHTVAGILFAAFCLFTVIAGVAGIVMVAVGTAQKRVAGERLSELLESRQLPEARVVVR